MTYQAQNSDLLFSVFSSTCTWHNTTQHNETLRFEINILTECLVENLFHIAILGSARFFIVFYWPDRGNEDTTESCVARLALDMQIPNRWTKISSKQYM